MSIADERTPLVQNHMGCGQLAVMLALTGSLYSYGGVFISLAVIAAHKAGLTSIGLDKSDISKGQTLFWVGWGIGSALIMPCLDRFGRKLPCLGLLVLGLVFVLLSTQAPTPFCYAVCVFFVGCAANIAVASNLLMQESIPERFRYLGMVVQNVLWSISTALVAVVGSSLTRQVSWHTETLLWEIPFALALLLGLVFLSDSPEFWKARAEAASEGSSQLTVLGAWQRLFCDPDLRSCICATVVCWTAANVGAYGIDYTCGTLSSSLYANMAFVGVVNLIGYSLAGPIMNSLGPRKAQLIAFAGAVASMFVCAFLPAGSWRVALALVAHFFLDVVFTTIYVLAVDCFPAECRGTALGVANCVARISGLITPLFALMEVSTVSLIICALCAAGGLATWTLPGSTPTGPASEFLESDSERKV